MADIFVSYTSSDRKWAEWIGMELEELGHTAHVHEWEVPAGGNVVRWMKKRFERAHHTLCVVSASYLTTHYSALGASSRCNGQRRLASDSNFSLPMFCR